MSDLQQWLNRQGASRHARITRGRRIRTALRRWLRRKTR